MSAARRILTGTLALFAAAVVFSPLAAALGGSGLNAAALQSAIRHVASPFAGSIKVSAAAAALALAIGFPFAVLVDRAGPAIRRICWTLALLTLIVPPYIVAESAIVTLGPAGKISRGLALFCGLGPPACDGIGRARFAVAGFVYTTWSAGAVLGGCYFAIVALAVAAANRRTDRRLYESALLARGRRGVVQVAAHMLIPPAIGAALLVFALALTESVVPQLLRVHTVGEAIYEQIELGELPLAAALSLPLLPLILLAGAAGAYVLLRARTASLAGLEGEVPKFTAAPAGRMGAILGVVITLIAIVPGLIIPLISLTWLLAAAKLPPATAGGHRVLRASGFFDSLSGAWELARDDAVRTTLLSTAVATFAIVISIALVRPLLRARWGVLLGGLGAGLAIPGPVVGLGLIALWNHGVTSGIYQSAAVVALAWLARFLPVGILLAQAALSRVPAELEHAAALAGRGPAGRFFAVVLPTAAPGLVAAWLAIYVLSATEFAATLLVAPPGAPLLAPSVVNLMRRGQDPEIAACQVLLLSVVAAPLALLAAGAGIRSAWRKWP